MKNGDFSSFSVKMLYFATPIVFYINFAVYSKLSQMTLFKQVVKAELTHTFVHDDCNRIGQIERSCLFDHGDTDCHIVIIVQQIFSKSFGFSAEKQEVVWRKMSLIVSYARFCRAKIKMRSFSVHCVAVYMPIAALVLMHPSLRVHCKKVFEIFINYKIRQMPIVKPRAFQRFVADVKADGLYDMHLAACCGGCSHDVARILRNFRFYQNYVECHFLSFCPTFYLLTCFSNDERADVDCDKSQVLPPFLRRIKTTRQLS